MQRLTRAESREANRRALLAAAADVVVEHGFDAAMLTEIAERAGLTKGAIYSIFGSKRELLIALVRELFLRVDDGAAAGSGDVVARARAHTAIVERAGPRDLQLEVELAGLAMRDPAVLAVVAEERRRRISRVGEALGSEPLARALIALEQGWALEIAFGGPRRARQLQEAAAALVTGSR